MKPIAIIQACDFWGARRLTRCLEGRGIPSVVFRPEHGQTLPVLAKDYAGIVVLDTFQHPQQPLAAKEDLLRLLRSAVSDDVPVLAQGVGAECLTLAAAGRVLPRPWPFVGWSHSWVAADLRGALALPSQHLDVFLQQYSELELPRGANRLMFDRCCLNRGYRLGRHLALQCNLEVWQEALRRWCAHHERALGQLDSPDVQPASEVLRKLAGRLSELEVFAELLYQHWLDAIVAPRVRVPLSLLRLNARL